MSSIYLLLAFLSPIVLITLLLVGAKNYLNRRKTAPFDISAEQRMPGHGLLTELISQSFDLSFYLTLSFIACLYPLAMYGISTLTNTPAPSHWMTVLIGLGLFTYCFVKALKHMRKRNDLRLGLEAEWAVSSQLNALCAQGYRIFHDIQCEKFNIDHLVVGPNGVFCIETKGRSKPLTKSKVKQFKVTVDGSTLNFPTWQDTSSIAQAKRQATWVANWLTQATGAPVVVSPVLVIPGWYIDAGKKPDIPILALKSLAYRIGKLPPSPLTPQQIQQICYQVEQRVKRGDDSF